MVYRVSPKKITRHKVGRKICKKTEKGLLLGGLFLVAAVCGITGGAVWALLALCREVSAWLYLAVSAVL